MAESDLESRLVVVLRESALQEAATMTLGNMGRLRMAQPDDPMAQPGETIVLTNADRSFDVVAYIEATDQGVMLVKPLEIISTARSYRTTHPTPSGP